MRIHHLNCGSHCPIGGAFFDGRSGGLFADLCTHCLLIELADTLVLVDTGYGLGDIWPNPRRLAHTWPLILNTRLREKETAIRQVEALGYNAADVGHIVLTHLDFDHAGGIEDFPRAIVHVMARERDAAEHERRSFVARQRYRPLDWDGVQNWRTYAGDGETWFGFDSVRDLDGLPPEILMVPLAGHTSGHAGVAIRLETGWLLDAGDAYLHHDQLAPDRARMPPGLAIYNRIMCTEGEAAATNLQHLRALNASHGNDIEIFCAHDTLEFRRLKDGGSGGSPRVRAG